MRKRILSALAALAVLAGAGLVGAQLASAAPENPALTGDRVQCSTSRGEPRYLAAPCNQYRDEYGQQMWYVGPIAVPGAAGYQDSIDAMVADYLRRHPAAQVTVTPTVTSTSVTNPPGDVDPVLSLAGTPGTKSVNLQWTADNPPSDDTVSTYCVRYKKTTSSAWHSDTTRTYCGSNTSNGGADGTATVNGEFGFDVGKVRHTTMSDLDIDTQYQFQVRAKYNSSQAYGGWSNTVTATTDGTRANVAAKGGAVQ